MLHSINPNQAEGCCGFNVIIEILHLLLITLGSQSPSLFFLTPPTPINLLLYCLHKLLLTITQTAGQRSVPPRVDRCLSAEFKHDNETKR